MQLKLPMVTGATRIEGSPQQLMVEREIDGFRETYEVDAPAALSIHPAAAVPRDPPLGGIAVAFDQMPVETLTAGRVGLDPSMVGDAGSPTRVLSMKAVQRNRACRWIEGTPVAQADALVRQLVDAGLIG